MMAAGFTLARLGALDLDRAARLHRDSFAPMGERGWTRQDLASLMSSPGNAGFLLAEGEVDIGMALCRVVDDEAELLAVAVEPGHRRRGAARRLLDAVIGHARDRGARTLFLEVGADNPGARTLYDSLGFVVVGKRAGYYPRPGRAPADAFVMRLNLT
jgi:ribosomal-protein-alanine N-acetyltransferase